METIKREKIFDKLIDDYLKELKKIAQLTDTTDELSFRPAFDILLNGLSESLDKKELSIIHEPLRQAFGAPDYKLKTDNDFLIGYIETKGLSSNLIDLFDSEQIERYREAGQRFILTNFIEFVLFDYQSNDRETNVRPVEHVKIINMKNLLEGKKPDPSDIDLLMKLFDRFLQKAVPDIDGARGLAKRMANIAHIIRDSISDVFEKNTASTTLQNLYKAFKEILMPDLKTHLTINEIGKGVLTTFDDLYAQTIVYGLFAARCNHDERRGLFTRRLAAYDLPKTNPFLKKLFEQIAGTEIEDEPFCWAVEYLAHLLAAINMSAVLNDFGKRKENEDPVIHFYETFLKEYDPKLRVARGVYYTPEPVVSYIVRSVDYLLKTRFNKPKGLVDENTLILDPACGTGTFLYNVIDFIRFQFANNKGKWNSYVKAHILPRIFGFELLMAPYSVAHMKLGLQLAGADMPELVREDWKYDFSGNERLGIYLTNTLEEAFKKSDILFASWITDEAEAAAKVKKELPIMVVLGNPPYSGHSINRSDYTIEIFQEERWVGRGKNKTKRVITYKKPKTKKIKTWIGEKIKDYYQVDCKPLGEKNPKWLQDDYVKFIRFGQWRIENTGKGILAFITNHGYLDNPTFRGMRQNLMNTFTDIYILDLHGNAKKKEKCPDGSKDENVFDIQQGVSIGIFVKEEGKKRPANVHHKNLWGLRGNKYSYLFSYDFKDTEWIEMKPQSPYYLFTPQDKTLLEEYKNEWKINEIFPVNSAGIVTARDNLTIKWTQEEIWQTIINFSKLDTEKAREEFELRSDVRDWKVELAQKDLIESGLDKKNIVTILYRPFDIRYTYYTGKSRGFHCMPRPEVMNNMIKKQNIAMSVSRSVRGEPWRDVLASKYIIEFGLIATRPGNSAPLFPLYIYNNKKEHSFGGGSLFLFEPQSDYEVKKPNLAPEILSQLTKKYKITPKPEDIFYYIYSILYSNTYRSRYAEFLKIDFPRIPFTKDFDLFTKLVQKGSKLVSLHLMESQILDDMNMQPNYPVKGSNTVETVTYKQPGDIIAGNAEPINKGRVYINKTQYFEGVELEVWNFYIGGYKVCNKWLKDRKDRKLSLDEITHYQKIVVALRETKKLMKEIDDAIPEWPIK